MDAADSIDDFAEYLAECDEHLAIARGILLTLEASPDRIESSQLNELFRNFHTIKGLSGMVGVGDAEELAHQVESYLGAIRNQSVTSTEQGVDLMLASVHKLEEVIGARRDRKSPPDINPLVERIADLHAGFHSESQPPIPVADRTVATALTAAKQAQLEAAVASGARIWKVIFTPSTELAGKGISVNTIRDRLQTLGEIVHAEPAVVPGAGIRFSFLVASTSETFVEDIKTEGLKATLYQPPQIVGDRVTDLPRSGKSLGSVSLVRVDLGKLDELMRTVGELVITRSRLQNGLGRVSGLLPAREARELEETSLTMERLLRELREGVMRVRLVPVRDAFARMRLVVRDLARSAGKEIELHLTGEGTEVDKFVVERVSDPLIHLVRNAVSHGLENSAERLAAGKSPQGHLHLRAEAAGGAITIEVEDDGRGVDAQRILEHARSAGLVPSDRATDAVNVLDLICTPGFSTQPIADRVSGRGVGMDVVRRTIEDLGGTLTMATRLGLGTKFTARLPLTLAIADALIVEVAGQAFAIPQAAIREVIEVRSELTTTFENNELVRHHDGVLPLLRLGDVFGSARSTNEFPALVVGETGKLVALGVDRLLGLREIVVRRLADPLVQSPGLAGATELGDGRAVLILDAASLARHARTRHRSNERAGELT